MIKKPRSHIAKHDSAYDIPLIYKRLKDWVASFFLHVFDFSISEYSPYPRGVLGPNHSIE